MFHSNQKKKGKILILGGLLIFLSGVAILFGTIGRMKKEEGSTQIVAIKRNEPRSLVFYKDDCSECQKVFPKLYYHNLLHDDILFINLNQSKNRKYISQYHLKSVPTIVTHKDRYVGTDTEMIQQILDQNE